jgi:hypothetical protein
LKVSDEFAVPLCRGHHRELHQAGNELGWWEKLNIKPLEVAKGLWEQTHPRSVAVSLQPTSVTCQSQEAVQPIEFTRPELDEDAAKPPSAN